MNTREAIALRIRQLCKERKLTPNAIAISSAVPQSTVKSILNGESQNPGCVTIKKYAMVLKSPWASFSARLNLTAWSRKSNKFAVRQVRTALLYLFSHIYASAYTR